MAIRLFFHVPTSSVPHHVHPIPLVRVPFPIIGLRDPIERALSDDEKWVWVRDGVRVCVCVRANGYIELVSKKINNRI